MKDELELFEDYLVAKRAKELAERVDDNGKPAPIKTGLNYNEVLAAISELDSAKYQAIAKKIYAYQDNLIDHLVDAQVLSQDSADAIRRLNKEYVPFYRYMGDDALTGTGKALRESFVNLPDPVKRIKGSERSIISPIYSIVKNTIFLVDVAERNRPAVALAKLHDESMKNRDGMGWLMERLPTPMSVDKVYLERIKEDLKEAGIPEDVLDQADLERMALIFSPVRHVRPQEKAENIVTIYRDGKPVFYKVHPELYRAMQFLDQPAANAFFRLLRPFTQAKRAGAVLNPDFIVRNPVRDVVTASIFSHYGLQLLANFVRGIGDVIGKTDLYHEWKASGGAQATQQGLE